MNENTVQIVTLITAAVTTLGLAYIRARFTALEAEIKALKKMLEVVHSLVGVQSSDPVLMLRAVIVQLESERPAGHIMPPAVGQSQLIFPPGYEGLVDTDDGSVG